MSKEGNRAKVQAVLPPGWTVCTRSPGGVGTKYGFVHNAPPEVVVQERQRLADFERTRAGLARHIEQVRALAVT